MSVNLPRGTYEAMMAVNLPDVIMEKDGPLYSPTKDQYFNVLKEWYLNQGTVVRDAKTGNDLILEHYKAHDANAVLALGVVYAKASKPYEKVGNSDDQTVTAMFSWLLSSMGLNRADFAGAFSAVVNSREVSVPTYYEEPNVQKGNNAGGAKVVQSLFVSVTPHINVEKNKTFVQHIQSFEPTFAAENGFTAKVNEARGNNTSLIKYLTGGNAPKGKKGYQNVENSVYQTLSTLSTSTRAEGESKTGTAELDKMTRTGLRGVSRDAQAGHKGIVPDTYNKSKKGNAYKLPHIYQKSPSKASLKTIEDIEQQLMRGCYLIICSLMHYIQNDNGARVIQNESSTSEVEYQRASTDSLKKIPATYSEINSEMIEQAISAGLYAAGGFNFADMTGEFMGVPVEKRYEGGTWKFIHEWAQSLENSHHLAWSVEANKKKIRFLAQQRIKNMAEYKAILSFFVGQDIIVYVAGVGPGRTKSPLADRIESAEKARKNNLNKLANAAKPTDSSLAGLETKREELANNLHQCILLAAMPVLEELSIGMREADIQAAGEIDAAPYKTPDPYGGRIIPVSIKPYQNTINALTLPAVSSPGYLNGLQQYIDSSAIFVKGYSTFISLSKVVKEFKDFKTGKLKNEGREVKLPLPFAFAELIKSEDGTNIGKEIFMKNRVNKIREGPLYKDNIVLIKSINIDFKGGNMATAKSDVEVKMSFLLPDIRFLKQRFTDTVEIGGETYSYTYSFMDLITYTNNNTSTGFASVFRNQYHPDYNRLLLESFVYYKKPLNEESSPTNAEFMNETLREMPLVLDLAVVDHEIKKNNKTNQAEITINYRGYVDSVMTDPSNDALAGPEQVDNRVNREIDLQKKLANGCTIEQIREAIRTYQVHAFGESTSTISRIVETLAASNKLFNVRVDQSAVRKSLNSLKTRIETPLDIMQSVKKKLRKNDWLNGYNLINFHIRSTGKFGTKADILKIIKGVSDQFNFKNFVSAPVDYKAKFEQMYIYTNDPKNTQLSKPAKQALSQAKKERASFSNISEKIEYFYFGDLVDVLLDGIHKHPTRSKTTGGKAEAIDYKVLRTDTDQMYEATNKEKTKYYFRPDPVKVILCSFDWYLPMGGGKTKKYTTNLADVPIALDWFAEWFRLEIIEKQLTYYPIASFLKKLAMTVITRILGEVCFDVGSDKKVLFRAQTEIGLFDGDPKNAVLRRRQNKPMLLRSYLDHLEVIRKGRKTSRIDKAALTLDYSIPAHLNELPLLKKVGAGKTLNSYQRSHYCSYIMLYPANASSYEFQAKQQNFSAKDAGIIEFNYKTITTTFTNSGYQHNNSNAMISSMDFSKQDAPYRREVKFFASNQGNYAQISGVYNVKIKLSKAAYFLFPGQLIWVNAGLGDSVTNVKSMAFILGLGGYYQIISVNHNIEFYGGSSPNSTTTIEAAWVAYGIDQQGKDKKYAYYKKQHIKAPTKPQSQCNSTLPNKTPVNNFRIPDVSVPNMPPPNPNNNNSNVPQDQPENTNTKTDKFVIPFKKGDEVTVDLFEGTYAAQNAPLESLPNKLTVSVVQTNNFPNKKYEPAHRISSTEFLTFEFEYSLFCEKELGGNAMLFYDKNNKLVASYDVDSSTFGNYSINDVYDETEVQSSAE